MFGTGGDVSEDVVSNRSLIRWLLVFISALFSFYSLWVPITMTTCTTGQPMNLQR